MVHDFCLCRFRFTDNPRSSPRLSLALSFYLSQNFAKFHASMLPKLDLRKDSRDVFRKYIISTRTLSLPLRLENRKNRKNTHTK